MDYNIFKYSYVKHLKNKYENSFELKLSNNIYLLPPIIKKILNKHFLAFFVCNDFSNKNEIILSNPIGIVLVDKNSIEKTFDFKNYILLSKEKSNLLKIDSNYLLKSHKISNFDIEKYKLLLEKIHKIADLLCQKKINTNNDLYQRYFEDLKKIFPNEIQDLFNHLQYDEILQADVNLNLDIGKLDFKKHNERIINKIEKDFFDFVKKDMSPALIQKGAFSKLVFYKEIGNLIKPKKEILIQLKQKISPIERNILNDLKYHAIKVFTNATDNNFVNDSKIDTISTLLIVFLNAMLVEEKQKTINEDFEEEILESKLIFEENINNIDNEEAKQILKEIFDEICKDYYEIDINNFSPTFYAYLKTFSQD